MADTQADSNVDPKEISNEPIKSNEPNNFKDSNDSEKTQHQVDPPIIDIDQKESPAENAWEKSEFKAPEASERNDDTSIGDKLNMSSEHLTGQLSNQEDLPTNSMELETTLEMQQQQVMGSPEPSDIDTDDLFFDEEEHDSAVDDFMYTSSETIAGDSASPHLTEAELNKPTDASLDIGRNLLAVEDEKDVEMVADVKQDHSETKTDPVAGTATENAAGQGESPYPRTLSPSGEPVKYVYTEILAKLENGFERQAWVVASQIPDTFQPMLAREPFGYSGADMVKLGGVGVTLALAIFFYITIIAFLICLDGCVNSSKMKKFAYEALEKSTILQTEAEQLQRKIKDLQNEVIITQGEAQELKDSIASANEEKSELQVQINSLQLNVAALEQQKAALDESVLTVQTQCDQNAGLVTEWQVYSKSQQDLYEAELLKSQHHQVELEASRAALAEAETKLQNSAQLSGEEADQLKQEVEDMKSDFSKKEKDLRLKIDELKRELDDTSREKADTQAKLDKISSQLNEMEEDVSKTNAANEELSSTLELRNSELEILRTCVSELRDATSLESDDEDDNSKQQAIDALLDVSKAKTELRKVTEEYVTLKEEHNKATESIARLEEETRDKERSAASLKEELELVQKDKTNTEGAMAQISKLLAEANLTIGRLKIAAEEAKQQRLQDSQAARVSELRAEISQMEERVAKTEEEYKTNEKDMRKRLLEGEKKAHESWLLHRDSERKVTSLKQELETLRRNYATLEADYQVGEESYRQLQLQMEARERDDASVTESKRPHSRSSMRSSRFEEGHRSSLSPFNGSEAEPPKPVDPLRAPPPASTYKKGERKKKSKVLKARKEESPVNMADNIEWNESLGPYGEQMAPAWGGDPNYSNSMYPQQPDMYPSHPQMAYPPQDMLYHGQAPISQNPQYDMPYLQYQQNMLPGSNMMTPPPQLLSQTPPNQQMQNFSQQNIGHSTQLPPPQQ
ncbi:hypothetical protein EB796_016822 [Bugula neritina]|uniref:Uncharacterized protein n=1 Tax=Bugula neritina TaxID=10212 RepID=A0A7J7JEY0_BUGNE|nr:hypothetical protein EB796_016822 [Bugula neritina]